MADINQVISLGFGSPADIEHVILFGLNSNPVETALAVHGELDGARARGMILPEPRDVGLPRSRRGQWEG